MSFSPAEIRAIVVGALLAMFLSALDQTVVAIALPPIAADLGDFTLISWVVTSYLLTSTCVMPIVGKLSDLYGRRPMLRICLIIFMASSALCALAPGMIPLILARALQGIGGGGIVTLAQTIIGDVVAPRERGRYAVYITSVWVVSALLGPMLGGVLTEYYGWPWIFWINLPLGLAALLATDRALRKLPIDPRRSPIDYASIALLCSATVALLLILSLGGKRLPWTAPAMLAFGVATLILAGLFVRRQLRAPEPILPPRFLRDRVIAPLLAASFIVFGAYIVIAVMVPVYFQVALGLPVSEASLLMIPLMLSSTVTSGLSGRYSRRTGRYKLPPIVGLPVTIAALIVLAVLAERLSAPTAAVLFMVAGLGLGPFFPCSTVAAQNAVERHDLGAVSGAVGFSRTLGGAIAIAAGSALVLGLVSGALPDSGHPASLEDLARSSLSPEARAVLARSFGVLFGASAAAFVIGLAIFARVEDRPLRGQPAASVARAAD
ncbi:MAG: MFS transporter [Proteobacteria bacterium]|nr:MFS transporter [Pseudomonadota bacterium]